MWKAFSKSVIERWSFEQIPHGPIAFDNFLFLVSIAFGMAGTEETTNTPTKI